MREWSSDDTAVIKAMVLSATALTAACCLKSYIKAIVAKEFSGHLQVVGTSKGNVVVRLVGIEEQPRRRYCYASFKNRESLELLVRRIHDKLIPLVIEEKEWNILSEEAASKCGDVTAPLMVHDEFCKLMGVCEQIKGMRKKIQSLEEAKLEAVKEVMSRFAESTDIPYKLITRHKRSLLKSCCRAFDKRMVDLYI